MTISILRVFAWSEGLTGVRQEAGEADELASRRAVPRLKPLKEQFILFLQGRQCICEINFGYHLFHGFI